MVQMTGRMAKLNGAAAGVRDEWMMMKFVIAKMTASWREATLTGIPNTHSNIPRNTMLTPTNVALPSLQHTSYDYAYPCTRFNYRGVTECNP